jgi:hypothetical protein
MAALITAQELQALDEEGRRTRRNSEAVLPTKPPPEAHAKVTISSPVLMLKTIYES